MSFWRIWGRQGQSKTTTIKIRKGGDILDTNRNWKEIEKSAEAAIARSHMTGQGNLTASDMHDVVEAIIAALETYDKQNQKAE